MPSRRSRVREPIQVYIDRDDRVLLDRVSARTGLSRAEVLRRGLRTFAGEVLLERGPGSSLDALIGVLKDTDSPPDLAERHDEYLEEAYEHRKRRRSRRR